MTNAATLESRTGDRARDWWKQISDPRSGDPGARAQLRRCRSTNDVLAIPAGIRLARVLGALAGDSHSVDARFARALDLSRVLVHVEVDVPTHPMRDVGWPKFPGSRREADTEARPKLSEARFRRLLQTEGGEDLVAQFSRLVALMARRVNVGALSDAFRWWDHPDGRTKQRWAFEYFNAGAATRPANGSPEDIEE